MYLCERNHLDHSDSVISTVTGRVWHQTLSSVITHHSLPHTRLAIHLQDCNYFALSSLERSHYYILHINLALQLLLRSLIHILCLFACFKNKAYICVKVAFVTSDELYTFILWF